MERCYNVIIHYWPDSELIARAAVNIRYGTRICSRAALANVDAARKWLERVNCAGLPCRVIVHGKRAGK